jgi:tetratricopeptide (TPR) repeat protein
VHAELTKDPTPDKGADDADDNVTDQADAANYEGCKHASDQPDNKPRNEIHCVHFCKSGILLRNGCASVYTVIIPSVNKLLGSLLLATMAAATPASSQTVQYTSPAGVQYMSLADTGAIARAQSALAADPRNVGRYVALGVAQSGARQFRDAIETFTRGLEIAPNNALLYRWRGHRYLSTRQFDKAEADLARGSQLDSTIYGNWYHLGIVRFVKGDFNGAADAFRHALPKAPDAGELAGSTDWLWMSLARAGRMAEAKKHLDAHTDTLPINNAYSRRLKLYRNEIKPVDALTDADTGDVNVATIAYGVGNWWLVHGDTSRARAYFDYSVMSGGWPGFGFIMSEVDLKRTTSKYPSRWWSPISKVGAPSWEIMPQEAGPGEVILSKRNELGVLSNFAPTPFTYRGKRYASLEGFWQSMLYPEGADDARAKGAGVEWKYTRDQVAQMTAFEAKAAGDLAEANMKKLGIDWVTFEGKRMKYRGSKQHYDLIVAATREKVKQNPEVQKVLPSTGNLVLKPDHHQEADAPPEWRYYDILMRIRDRGRDRDRDRDRGRDR